MGNTTARASNTAESVQPHISTCVWRNHSSTSTTPTQCTLLKLWTGENTAEGRLQQEGTKAVCRSEVRHEGKVTAAERQYIGQFQTNYKKPRISMLRVNSSMCPLHFFTNSTRVRMQWCALVYNTQCPIGVQQPHPVHDGVGVAVRHTLQQHQHVTLDLSLQGTTHTDNICTNTHALTPQVCTHAPHHTATHSCKHAHTLTHHPYIQPHTQSQHIHSRRVYQAPYMCTSYVHRCKRSSSTDQHIPPLSTPTNPPTNLPLPTPHTPLTVSFQSLSAPRPGLWACSQRQGQCQHCRGTPLVDTQPGQRGAQDNKL